MKATILSLPTLILWLSWLVGNLSLCHAFILRRLPNLLQPFPASRIDDEQSFAANDDNSNVFDNRRDGKQASKKQRGLTIAELRDRMLQDPAAYQLVDSGKQMSTDGGGAGGGGILKRSKRTRQKVTNPRQTYLYKAQREKLGIGPSSKNVTEPNEFEGNDKIDDERSPIVQAREFGMVNAAAQHCEVLIGEVQPQIYGRIRVGDETTGRSGAFAYVIFKPPGWSILGGDSASTKKKQTTVTMASKPTKSSKDDGKQIVRIKGKDGAEEVLEFDEHDVLAVMTADELAEWKAQGGEKLIDWNGGVVYDDDDLNIPGWKDVAKMSPKERLEAEIEEEDFDPNDIVEFNPDDVLALLTAEERAELGLNDDPEINKKKKENAGRNFSSIPDDESLDPVTLENWKRIVARANENSKQGKAVFASASRPSLVAWLKDLKAAEGSPIRGGTFWKALAGATNVDDSGLVLLCPKDNVENVFVDVAAYVAVVGNGNHLSPKSKQQESTSIPKEFIDMSIMARVRKGRDEDAIQTVRIVIPEHISTCTSVIEHVQTQFQDGIRGDPVANPFDRRAARRLIHCQSLSVSSLAYDEDVKVDLDALPDDIAIVAERLNNHKYTQGSFLGRASLRNNPLTNAYREINGAADGFPGWIVDRYGDWLLVQHDEKEYRGPLPSIHDGNTAGAYYLKANPDRSSMGASADIRPTLLEGRPAPDMFPILENGVTYLVSLDKDLSTGIFLDQRLHRAWLTRNCDNSTRVLNCFAHCGAFSVAAASAGASTVSLDLSKKWLDRVQPQLEANGIKFDERHDCIYGDCKYPTIVCFR